MLYDHPPTRLGEGEIFATFDNALSERVADAVEIYVFDALAGPVGAGVDLFAGKGVLGEEERVFAVFEAGVGLEVEAGDLPEPIFVAVEVIGAQALAEL